jgi:hypothetical protein
MYSRFSVGKATLIPWEFGEKYNIHTKSEANFGKPSPMSSWQFK